MRKLIARTATLMLAALLAACGGGGGGGGNNNAPAGPAALADLELSAGALDQAFQSSQFDYTSTVGYLATATTVTPTTADSAATVTVNGVAVPSGSASDPIPLAVGANNKIILVVTAADGVTTDTYTVTVTRESANQFAQRAYIKASNTGAGDQFGYSVALSGNTLAVGAPGEASNATGVNGDQKNTSLPNAGAVYVFTRSGATWRQQAYIKASNTDSGDNFGYSIALSGDTLAVGAPGEDSDARGINGDQKNNGLSNAGAAYVLVRSGATWTQQAYIKASNTDSGDNFGYSVALSGNTLAVGATGEASDGNGENNNDAPGAGAAYVFTRSNGPPVSWAQQAYVKASNPDSGDKFGYSVVLSGDTLVVGAPGEAGNGSSPLDNSASNAGAAYVFTRSNGPPVSWAQQAYVKASSPAPNSGDNFGWSVALLDDTLVVGVPGQNSNTGAGYMFTRSNGPQVTWSQLAYFQASNPAVNASFGWSLALSDDMLAVGAPGEASKATGIDGDQNDTSMVNAGAVYTFQ
jgi:Cadherin-like beta sandwich domain/FG-GAP repeat